MDLTRAAWRKTSYSHAEGNCVEVASLPGAVAVRDSKDQGGPALTFTPAQWRRFTTNLRPHRDA
jgi:hypothetical protein